MQPTSAPEGSALARLFEAKREIRKLERENAELRKNKDQEIEKLTAETVRHKELLEFYSVGVQSKKMVISECLKVIDALSLESFPLYGAYSRDVEDTLIKVREILKAEAKTETPPEKPPESSVVCLVCGGEELDWHWPMTGEADEVWHRVTCQDCDANWQDVYTFSGIDNLKKGKD